MRKIILLAALATLGCAGRGAVQVAPGMDVARYRRVGVVPFQDPAGQGKAAAEAVALALSRFGFVPVDVGLMGHIFMSLKLEPGAELSMQDLLDIREVTQADVLVFGNVQQERPGRPRKLTFLMMEAQMGELVAQGSMMIPAGREAGLEEAAQAVMKALRRDPAFRRLDVESESGQDAAGEDR